MTGFQSHKKTNSNPEKYVTAWRTCLRCRCMFRSEWIGNRICKTCLASGDWKASQTTAHSTHVTQKRGPAE